jgi:hypothetical protein
MRFSLRTLLIVLLVVPPTIVACWMFTPYVYHLFWRTVLSGMEIGPP